MESVADEHRRPFFVHFPSLIFTNTTSLECLDIRFANINKKDLFNQSPPFYSIINYIEDIDFSHDTQADGGKLSCQRAHCEGDIHY